MYSTNKIVKTITLIAAFVLAATTARAVSPQPDRGYPGYNTAEADSALLGLTTGMFNTAVVDSALLDNSTGNSNTAIANQAMLFNGYGSDNTAVGDVKGANSQQR
jgi:hypothetical protein